MSDYVRLTDTLKSFWNNIEKINGVPQESDINVEQLEAIWNDCYQVQVMIGQPYRYNYLGSNLIEAYGDDISRTEVESLVYPSVEQVAANFERVKKERQPFEDNGEFININNMLIKYRQILLPFGDANGVITHIVGGMRWRPF